MSFLRKYAVFGLILIGFGIRIHWLNDVSVSPDERNVINKFLPVTFWELLNITTMHGFPEHAFANILIWSSSKVGEQVFILRWQAVFFAMLTLAILYKATQKMLGPAYALAITCLLTFSGYHMLFSHRIRGYSVMIFFAITSFYFLWRGMGTNSASPRSRWQDWLLFALISGLAIYNQLFTSTLLATQGIIIAIWLIVRALRQRPASVITFLRQQALPPLFGGLGSLAIAMILFTPILPQFFQNFVADDSHFPVSTASLLATLAPYVVLFDEYSGSVPIWSSLLFLIFIGAGMVHLLQIKPGLTGVFLGWLLLPILMAIVSQIYIPWFYVRDRYIVYMLPAYMILAGAGWIGLLKLVQRVKPAISASFFGLSLMVVVIISTLSISNYMGGVTKGNWQDVSNFLAQNARPTDIFICEPFNHGWEDVDLPPTDACTRNLTHRIGLQMQFIYPIYNLYTVATRRALEENPILLQRNSRVWLVVWDLPETRKNPGSGPFTSFDRLGHTLVLGPFVGENTIAALTQALAQTSVLAESPSTQFALLTRLADLQAALGQTSAAINTLAQARTVMPTAEQAQQQMTQIEQHLNRPSLIATPAHPLSVGLGDQVLFKGYSLMPEHPRPGRPLQLTLFWQALAPMQVNYSTFLHLRNQANQTVAQLDFSLTRPTSSWWIGDVLNDQRELTLPAELPAGQYRLLAGLYNPETLDRLPVKNDTTGENAIELTQIIISN